ncbi:hypothetical protein [Pikeienuella sp. HZG-20]|uniref:hypothetical protein n=1 Tax=Paludibacillus litoralis TaxID=3133267 RepID=UPI0030EE003A
MSPLADLDLLLLAIFAGAAFISTAGAVLVGAFLPRAAGPEGGKGFAGGAAVYAAALALVALIGELIFTATKLPWTVAVITAGLAFLAAPAAVQPIPAWLRESRAGLVLIAALAVVLLLLLPSPFTR